MSRKTARRNAFELCFAMSFYDVSELGRVVDAFFSEHTKNADDESYIKETVNGVFENITEIDGFIERFSLKWRPERIGKADLAILRLCVFEMLKMDGIPVSVSINEAIELAKKFGSEESPSFINGVLSGINREISNAE